MSKTSQDQPTSARPLDEQGREIDQWGLPINGPARLRALVAAGKPDPNTDPEAWVSAGATAVADSPPVAPANSRKGVNNG